MSADLLQDRTGVPQDVIRYWLTDYPGLTGPGAPLSGGAYLVEQRSPAIGAYAVVTRASSPAMLAVAEGAPFTTARANLYCYAGTQQAAEDTATAVRAAIESLRGAPVVVAGTGMTMLVSDNVIGPAEQPLPPDNGEPWCFLVSADFMMRASEE